MKIKELITYFGFEVDDAALKKLDKGIDDIKFGVIGLGATLVTTTATLFLMTKTAANSADAVKDLSISSGVAARDLQRLGYIAKINGSDMNSMAQGLKFLNKSIEDAAKDNTGEAAKLFRQLGISVRDSNGRIKDAAVVFEELAGAFPKIPSRAQKVAYSMQLMGRAGNGLIQTLEEGPEKFRALTEELDAFNGAMSDDQIEQLTEFNDSLDRTYSVIGAIRNQIALVLAPTMQKIIDEFRQFLIANQEVIKKNITGALKAMSWWLNLTWRVARRLGEAFMWLADKVGGSEWMFRALLIAITAISAGSVISGVITLIGLFKTLAVAVWAASAPLLLVVAKFVAIAAAIFLIGEDIIAFFQGKNSVTGVIVKSLIAIWNDFAMVCEALWNDLKNKISAIGDWIASKIAWIRGLFGGGVSGNLNVISNNVAGGQGVGGVPLAPVNNSTKNQSNNFNIGGTSVSVSVGKDTDPVAVGSEVGKGVNTSFGDMFNFSPAGRVLSPAVR